MLKKINLLIIFLSFVIQINLFAESQGNPGEVFPVLVQPKGDYTNLTIEIDGSVGPVGGIKQKVIAAKKAGAELILVPVANFDEAKIFETEETAVVAVDSFSEALSVISQYSSR